MAESVSEDTTIEPVGVTRAVFGTAPPDIASRSCMVVSAVLITTVSAETCVETKDALIVIVKNIMVL